MLLQFWLGALNSDNSVAGVLAEILEIKQKTGANAPAMKLPKFEDEPTALNAELAESGDQRAQSPNASLNQAAIPEHKKLEIPMPLDNPDGPKSDFLVWLQRGIKERRIKVNCPGAPVRFVKDGVLLVSPDLFQLYDGLHWRQVQQQFLKLKLHRKGKNRENVVTYRDADRPSTEVRGVFVTSPQRVFGTLVPSADDILVQKKATHL